MGMSIRRTAVNPILGVLGLRVTCSSGGTFQTSQIRNARKWRLAFAVLAQSPSGGQQRNANSSASTQPSISSKQHPPLPSDSREKHGSNSLPNENATRLNRRLSTTGGTRWTSGFTHSLRTAFWLASTIEQ